jgi:hypothetical protein
MDTLGRVSLVRASTDRSITLAVDRRIFPREMVKRAASTMTSKCRVLLDLDPDGSVLVTLGLWPDAEPDELRHLSGELGNLLVADLAGRNLDSQARAIRDLIVARALDGACTRGEPEDRGQP